MKLIYGGLHFKMSIGGCRLVAAPKSDPPFQADALVAEEDTFLVLSADPIVKAPREPLEEMIKQAHEIRPEIPGSILIRNRRPLEFLAIVHDLDQEPSWREEWISSALNRVFREVVVRKIRSLALPLLGTPHGSLEPERAARLFGNALRQHSPASLQRIWLIIPSDTTYKDLENIRSNLEG